MSWNLPVLGAVNRILRRDGGFRAVIGNACETSLIMNLDVRMKSAAWLGAMLVFLAGAAGQDKAQDRRKFFGSVNAGERRSAAHLCEAGTKRTGPRSG